MWIEYRYEDGSAWHGHPDDQTHELRIWPHEKEGFSWRVVTADVDANTPEGWSATLDDAKRHAKTAYMEWYGYSCLVGELEVSLQALKEQNAMLRDEQCLADAKVAEMHDTAVLRERAAVVAYLRQAAWWDCDGCGFDGRKLWENIELGFHRTGEGA